MRSPDLENAQGIHLPKAQGQELPQALFRLSLNFSPKERRFEPALAPTAWSSESDNLEPPRLGHSLVPKSYMSARHKVETDLNQASRLGYRHGARYQEYHPPSRRSEASRKL